MPAPKIVSVIGYFSFHVDHAKAFRKNCADMVELRDRESGHLASVYSFGTNGTAVSREDYDSADAVVRHMELGRHIFESTQALVKITGVELHGPEAELEQLRGLFDGMSLRTYVTEFGFRK